MKYSILFLAVIFSVSGFGQLQGVVLDKETSSPVAYTNIWIENGWEYYRGKWHKNQFGKLWPDDTNNFIIKRIYSLKTFLPFLLSYQVKIFN